jgi:predicted XRE-type DNA-binding protein
MPNKDKVRLTRSSGNVFLDLGFPPQEAEHLRVRSDLMIQVQKVIASRGMKHTESAKILGLTEARLSHLLQSRIDLFTTDALIDLLARLGVQVRLVLKAASRGRLKVA